MGLKRCGPISRFLKETPAWPAYAPSLLLPLPHRKSAVKLLSIFLSRTRNRQEFKDAGAKNEENTKATEDTGKCY